MGCSSSGTLTRSGVSCRTPPGPPASRRSEGYILIARARHAATSFSEQSATAPPSAASPAHRARVPPQRGQQRGAVLVTLRHQVEQAAGAHLTQARNGLRTEDPVSPPRAAATIRSTRPRGSMRSLRHCTSRASRSRSSFAPWVRDRRPVPPGGVALPLLPLKGSPRAQRTLYSISSHKHGGH
jgi:hypothetical protein